MTKHGNSLEFSIFDILRQAHGRKGENTDFCAVGAIMDCLITEPKGKAKGFFVEIYRVLRSLLVQSLHGEKLLKLKHFHVNGLNHSAFVGRTSYRPVLTTCKEWEEAFLILIFAGNEATVIIAQTN
jgi:hypothetical protein